jgi:hypothetical protein
LCNYILQTPNSLHSGLALTLTSIPKIMEAGYGIMSSRLTLTLADIHKTREVRYGIMSSRLTLTLAVICYLSSTLGLLFTASLASL